MNFSGFLALLVRGGRIKEVLPRNHD
jgi:hypothetical protein